MFNSYCLLLISIFKYNDNYNKKPSFFATWPFGPIWSFIRFSFFYILSCSTVISTLYCFISDTNAINGQKKVCTMLLNAGYWNTNRKHYNNTDFKHWIWLRFCFFAAWMSLILFVYENKNHLGHWQHIPFLLCCTSPPMHQNCIDIILVWI